MSTLVHTHPRVAFAMPRRISPATLGITLGLTAVAIWGSYLAMARAGLSAGLNAEDIAFIRYTVAGLIMLPWLLRHQPLRLAGVGLGRGIGLALLAGPLFVLIGAGGYHFAPLAHGAVVQPAALTIGALLAATLLFRERLSLARVAGVTTILVGLAVIAGPGLLAGSAATPVGDAMFAAAGLMWAGFTILTKRWGIGPIAATAVVSVLSMLVYAPGYLAMNGIGHLAAFPVRVLVPQIIVQGLLSGVVAVIAFSRAVQLLGAGRAASFPALVPAAAILFGVPITGEIPSLPQIAGLAVVTAGLLIAIGVLRLPTRNRHPATAR